MGFSLYTSTDLNTGLPTRITARHHFMMYTPRARLAFQHQQFFFAQREKLSTLLNTVSAGARVASAQHISLEYFDELTTAVTQLLSEAQTYSAWTYDQLERDGVQMEPFAEKVGLVETVARELSLRVEAEVSRKMSDVVCASKKRGRSLEDVDDEEMEESQQQQYPVQRKFASVKRYRRAPADHDMMVEPAFCGTHADRYQQTAWWSQPIYQ